MEGNLASYFQLQTNSEKYDRGCDENHMSSEKHAIHHFPEEDGISSDYSIDSYGLLDPDGTDLRCENAIHYEEGVDNVNDSNDSCCDEPSTNSSSDEILEDQIEMMGHIRQVSIRSTEIKDELRKVRKAFKKDVGDENIWQVVPSSGDESDNNRAKLAFHADHNKEDGRSIKTNLRKSPPKLDRNRGRTSHRRIENNEEDDYHVELRKDKVSIREKLSDSSTAGPEESLEVSCTSKKTVFGQRNRAVLTDKVLKRRQEEEETQLAVEKTNMMRKKFKDALLEKAIRSRTQSVDIVDDVIEVVCKSEVRKSINKIKAVGFQNRKSCTQTLAEMEQQEKAEEEKKVQIAAIRRKFKAQHKNILRALMQKHKEEKKAELVNFEEIEEKKKKRKIRGEKLLARRPVAESQSMESDGEAKNARTIRVKENEVIDGCRGRERGRGRGSGVAVGSGFASVRAHREHTADTDVSPHRCGCYTTFSYLISINSILHTSLSLSLLKFVFSLLLSHLLAF